MPEASVDGIEIHYDVYGSGPPLILLHGLSLDASMWDLQIPALATDHQVIACDLRGHGASGAPDHAYSIGLFADDLHHLLHVLGLKSSILLGLSLGGRVALQFALRYPEQTRALILADSQSETSAESAARFEALAGTARQKGMDEAAEVFYGWPLWQGLAKADPDRFRRERDRARRMSPVGFARSCLAITRMEPLSGRLPSISAPTLALAGEDDGPYLPYLDLYSEKIPGCRTERIPGAGHLSNLENPKEFNRAVRNFLKGLPDG